MRQWWLRISQEQGLLFLPIKLGFQWFSPWKIFHDLWDLNLRLEVQKLLLKKPSEEPLPEKDPLTGDFSEGRERFGAKLPGFWSAHIVGYPKIVGKPMWRCNILLKMVIFHGYGSLPEGKLNFRSWSICIANYMLFQVENCLQRSIPNGNLHRWLFHDHPKRLQILLIEEILHHMGCLKPRA